MSESSKRLPDSRQYRKKVSGVKRKPGDSVMGETGRFKQLQPVLASLRLRDGSQSAAIASNR